MARHYDGNSATTTTEAVFLPEVWAEGIYKFFERKSVFRGLVDDYSALVAGKGAGDIVHIPEIAIASATEKAEDADVAYNNATATETQLALNKHYYVAKLFSDIAEIQSEESLVFKYTKMMGESLSRQVDADIWGELDGLNSSQALATDDVLTAAEFEGALATLGEADVPYMDGECAMVVNPTLFADILNPSAGLAQYFIRNDASGDGSGLKTGMVGSLYGIEVYMSNTVATGGNASVIPGAIFHKSACAFAVQQDVRVQNEYSIDALGTKVVADLIYGAKILDDSDNIRGVKFTNAA